MGSDKEIRKGNYSDFKGLKRRGKEKGYKKAGEFDLNPLIRTFG